MQYQAAPLYPMRQTLGSVSSQPWPPMLTDTTGANDDLSGFAVHKALAPAASRAVWHSKSPSPRGEGRVRMRCIFQNRFCTVRIQNRPWKVYVNDDSLSWSCDLWHPATHRCYQAAWGLKSGPSQGHSLSKGCEGSRGRIDAVLDTDSETWAAYQQAMFWYPPRPSDQAKQKEKKWFQYRLQSVSLWPVSPGSLRNDQFGQGMHFMYVTDTSTGRKFALVEGFSQDLVCTGSIYHVHFAWQVWHGQLSPRFKSNKLKSFSGVEIDQNHVDKRILGGKGLQ